MDKYLKSSTLSKIVIASHNQGKLREIDDLLRPYGIETISAGALGLPEPEETETTFAGNARLKALASARGSGLPALSDDSGLAVDALGGEPGIYAARWAEKPRCEGGGRDFDMAMWHVHDRLKGSTNRRARFICALCLAFPDSKTEVFEGRVEGNIVWPPRGDKGFGYDPIFQALGDELTFAQITPEEKHAKSHRADAFAKFLKSDYFTQND
jgi:XTP/dITP diphosphohydrolase